ERLGQCSAEQRRAHHLADELVAVLGAGVLLLVKQSGVAAQRGHVHVPLVVGRDQTDVTSIVPRREVLRLAAQVASFVRHGVPCWPVAALSAAVVSRALSAARRIAARNSSLMIRRS